MAKKSLWCLMESLKCFYKQDSETHSTVLQSGDIFYASIGTEHVAHPMGEARILVIETQGSV